MPGFYQTLFTVSFVGLSWYGMLAVHELGHVLGAVLTGATVERVVLHPLTISRTDVSPNPYPAVVVWLGPVVGCLFPLAAWWTVPHSWTLLRNTGCFFAGFCLIANGLYLAVGSVQGVGDCHEMLRTGTSEWLLIAFGAVTVPA
ncbi:MAG: M50 family metallopeptidase, partial [Planctomycetaceae bacterium]